MGNRTSSREMGGVPNWYPIGVPMSLFSEKILQSKVIRGECNVGQIIINQEDYNCSHLANINAVVIRTYGQHHEPWLIIHSLSLGSLSGWEWVPHL